MMKRYIKGKSNKSLIDTAVKEAINMFMENDYDYVLNKIENNEPSDPTYARELDHEIEFLKNNNLVDGLSESDIRVVAKTVLKKIEDIINDLYHSYRNSISEDIEESDDIVNYDKYHTNLYGGDPEYCYDCGSKLIYDNDSDNFICPECINESNSSIRNYLLKVLRNEEKWMYSQNDDSYGIETDIYRVVSLVLDNKWDISKLIDYLEDNYGDGERYFIDQLIKLSRS